MKFIEITALEQLSPQDHLLYMQEVWAHIIELTPEHLDVEEPFDDFSKILNEFEEWIFNELNGFSSFCEHENSYTSNLMRESMDNAYSELVKSLERQGSKALLDSL